MKKILLTLVMLMLAVQGYAGTLNYNWIYIPKYPDPESENYPTYMDNFMDDVDADLWGIQQNKLNADTTSPSNVTALTPVACTIQDADGGLISCIDVSWTDSINTDINYYEVRYMPQGGTKYLYAQTTVLAIRLTGVIGNTTYCISVKGVDKQGNTSGYPTDNCTVTSGVDSSINPPTSATAAAGFKQVWLDWTNPTDKDLAVIEVWRADTNDRAGAVKIAEVKTDFYSDSLGNGVTKYYWTRAKDLSGNLSTWEPVGATSGISATTVTIATADIGAAQVTNTTIANATIDLAAKVQGQLPNANLAQITDAAKLADAIISAAKIATGVVDKTKLATGLSAIEKVTTLPTLPDAAYPEGYTVFLTTDDKLYRSTGSAWTTATATSDLSGTISTTQLADGAVTTIKIGDLQVDTSKLGTGAVTTIKIGDLQITADKLGNGSVGKVKFATGLSPIESVGTLPTLPDAAYPEGYVVFLTTDDKLYRSTGTAWTAAIPATDISGQITGTQITDDAITSPKIAANTIVAADIAAGTITASEIATDTITAGQIAASAIASSELAAGAVVAGKIAAGTIVAADIAADTITASQISANAITGSELAADSVTSDKITAGTIVASDIATGTITATQIAAGTITGTLIAADTIAAGNIAAGAITSSEINADAVTTDKIAAGAVQATDIQAGAITATHVSTNEIITATANIGNGLITSAKIADATIATADIGNGQITSALIADATITSADIASATITAANIANATITDAQIANATITSAKIASLSADKISAGTITGSTLQTAASPNPRIELSAGTKHAKWFLDATTVIASIGFEAASDASLISVNHTPSASSANYFGIQSYINATNRTPSSYITWSILGQVNNVQPNTSGVAGRFSASAAGGEAIGVWADGATADVQMGTTKYYGRSILDSTIYRKIAFGISGQVTAAGGIGKGTGWGVSMASNIYTVQFDNDLSVPPIVLVTPEGFRIVNVSNITVSGFKVEMVDRGSSGNLANNFNFLAIVP